MKYDKYYDKKEKKHKWRTRFQLHKVEYFPVADTKTDLIKMVDEIRANRHRAKFDLPITKAAPTLQELFDSRLPKIDKDHQRVLAKRVFDTLISLLPPEITITELKKAHFQKYIELRLTQNGKSTKKPVLPDTIDKELYAVSSALRDAPLYYPEMEDFQKPVIPKAKAKGSPKRKRERLVSKNNELDLILNELRKPRAGKQTFEHEAQRHRLADELEFRFETGLRRKEVARLKKDQFYPLEDALRDVIRWKTGTVTKYFPLTARAIEIINERLKINPGDYLFTEDGNPKASTYRTLKNVCEKLKIPYGLYTDGGFIAHDFRHSFASELIDHTDIKTASQLLGHSNIEQTADYLHTSEKKLKRAIRRMQKPDKIKDLVTIYKDLKRGRLKLKDFIEKIKKMTEF